MKINYFKAHFVTSEPNQSFINENFSPCRNIKIGSFEQFSEIRVTLMGKKFTYVNITGSKDVYNAVLFQRHYLELSGTNLVNGLMIDSISASHKFENKSTLSFSEFREQIVKQELSVKDNSRFPGIVIRCKLVKKGGCAVYFRTGSVNFIGFKHLHHIYKIKNKIEKALFE